MQFLLVKDVGQAYIISELSFDLSALFYMTVEVSTKVQSQESQKQLSLNVPGDVLQ
jgi:hypothetical protein